MNNQEKKFFKQFIGCPVKKFSEKPFKSKLIVNSIKGVKKHSRLDQWAFTFEEDDSEVQCIMCNVLV